MNTKKGLFRLTLAISIFVGITAVFLNELFLPRHWITIEIPKFGSLPSKEKGESKTIDYLIDNPEFKKLSKTEQSNLKRQFMESIPEIETLSEFGENLLRIEYTFKPSWRELGPLAFFAFVSPWLIYLFVRWVIVAFIIGGFRHKANS